MEKPATVILINAEPKESASKYKPELCKYITITTAKLHKY